ncbi:MAG TPA: DotU family type IV/VI secretion system protein [Pyrinomonadaceae bacterium]|nr:DotU family type IV/VI secretion system protein [Pyrinomonadaceae bacterium]
MNLIPYNESFLLWQFRDFYSEIIRLKQLINSRKWVAPTQLEGGNGNGNGHGNGDEAAAESGTWIYYPPLDQVTGPFPFRLSGTATSLAVRPKQPWSLTEDYASSPALSEQSRISLVVWQSLLAAFHRNDQQALRYEGPSIERYYEARYVMAAFADEVFIRMDWEGKQTWTSNLLESTLFQSHVAGELFFEKLDQMLRDRDPAYKSLATVYLTALSLGFRGRYHGANDHGRLRRYRQELFAFAFSRESNLTGESKIAFPDAYVQNLRQEATKKLTNPRLWLGVLGMVLLSYLAVSHILWSGLTSRLEQAHSQIVVIEDRLSTTPARKP